MANILQRFADIMSANINALLDKAEDPEKMIDQCVRDIQSDMGKVKAETAAVMASEKQAMRDLEENKAEVAKLQSYAEKALIAGNEADATQFLGMKKTKMAEQATLTSLYETCKNNSAKMRNMYDKLEKDLETLEQRRSTIKSKMAVAKAQQRINDIAGSVDGANDSFSAFDRMEQKANRMLDEAEAMSELNQGDTTTEDLMSKYDAAPAAADSDVTDELAALKAKLGV